MSKTHRLFALLQILRRHRRPVSAAVLAGEMGVSLRTVYRDVASLQTMGAEIEGEAGVGYVLKPSFLLPPIMFSDTEIEALALGLKWVGQRTDDSLAHGAKDAMAKISAILPDDLRRKLDDNALLIGPGWDKPHTVDLSVFRRVLKDGNKIKIGYGDAFGRQTERVIWPVALGFFESTRVLSAWCELRNEFRHFRTDRVQWLEPTAERVPKRRSELYKNWRQTILTKIDNTKRYTEEISLTE